MTADIASSLHYLEAVPPLRHRVPYGFMPPGGNIRKETAADNIIQGTALKTEAITQFTSIDDTLIATAMGNQLVVDSRWKRVAFQD